ncbi:type VI secretion system tube protein Hcp [Draconibacterium sp.]|nr:type VI secretion system tube protein Hcp [Draconibacterium sp.]
MKKSTFFLVFILACNFVIAQNYFIKFDGIDGESNNVAHRGWSDIESFNQELGSTPNMITTTRTRGPASLGKTISFVKIIDKSSLKIMEALTREKRFPNVEIEMSISENVIYRSELRNVAVTKYIVMGTESELPREEITISFEEQRVRYTEYDNSGRPKGNIETEYK